MPLGNLRFSHHSKSTFELNAATSCRRLIAIGVRNSLSGINEWDGWKAEETEIENSWLCKGTRKWKKGCRSGGLGGGGDREPNG